MENFQWKEGGVIKSENPQRGPFPIRFHKRYVDGE